MLTIKPRIVIDTDFYLHYLFYSPTGAFPVNQQGPGNPQAGNHLANRLSPTPSYQRPDLQTKGNQKNQSLPFWGLISAAIIPSIQTRLFD
ncbi:hypothetical protein [Spirosoma sp. KUDC1026]|uniref:hypothetical protein n=1 Tax=Spirosoma sp. KUDC1026 TaxID=2745947 RepID=UPI00159B86F4|nr:hypothetical protein [Spirosoma sp. KUDC1026]QKZ11247.1 hypothetical protein HU175_00775 [Spirosoma sp. KUDC1026]